MDTHKAYTSDMVLHMILQEWVDSCKIILSIYSDVISYVIPMESYEWSHVSHVILCRMLSNAMQKLCATLSFWSTKDSAAERPDLVSRSQASVSPKLHLFIPFHLRPYKLQVLTGRKAFRSRQEIICIYKYSFMSCKPWYLKLQFYICMIYDILCFSVSKKENNMSQKWPCKARSPSLIRWHAGHHRRCLGAMACREVSACRAVCTQFSIMFL